MTFDDDRAGTANQKLLVQRYNRIIIMLVAICCVSIGIAIGSMVRGIGSAKSDDNRLSISYAPVTPDALSAAFSRVSQKVEPSVVNIRITDGNAFHNEGTGSGIIVNPAGFILTNDHVVAGASIIKVKVYNGGEYEARVIGEDDETDLAVVKIDVRESLTAARLGDSGKLNVGDWVLAIGSPFGLEDTVTAGIISAKDREANAKDPRPFQQFLQTDAAINPGNSGGPLVNLAGEVVGINTQIATQTGFFNGIGFALPASTAADIYNQLVATGRVRRGFLGIKPKDLTPELARQNGLDGHHGVLVANVTSEDSPASRAGIRSGDVIVSINGENVKDYHDLIRRIGSLPVGSVASVAYMRNGQAHTASVKLEERHIETAAQPVVKPLPYDPHHARPAPEDSLKEDRPRFKPSLGLTVQTLSRETARLRGIEGAQGVLVTMVAPSSPAGTSDLKKDDVITEINGRQIVTLDDYNRAVRELKSGDEVDMKALRKAATGGPRRLGSVLIHLTLP